MLKYTQVPSSLVFVVYLATLINPDHTILHNWINVNNELEAVLQDVDKHGICPAWPRKNSENPRKTSDKTVKF